MNLLEYVSSARHFSEEEMNACARTGSCHQCGLCCVTSEDIFPLIIPSSPDEEVTLFHKKIGEVCPHLESNGEGETYCKAHDMKDHPELAHCRNWNGPDLNKHPIFGLMTSYEMLIDNFWLWAVHFSNPEELKMANEMIKKGLIRKVILQRFNIRDVTRLILKALELSELPHELFEMVQLKGRLEIWDTQTVQTLKDNCGLNGPELDPIKREFVERYLPA